MLRTWLRTWRRSPGLGTQYVLTIAVGMGAVSAVVSLMLALGFQPLPFQEPSQLVAVWEKAQVGGSIRAISPPDMADFAGGAGGAFAGLSSFSPDQMRLLDRHGAAQEIASFALQVAAFRELGVRPALGRPVSSSDRPFAVGAVNPAWINYHLWQTRYGGSPAVVGSTIVLTQDHAARTGPHYRIVGVLPPNAVLPLPFLTAPPADSVWTFLPSMTRLPRQAAGLFGIGRLRPGVTPGQAQAALAVVAERLGRQFRFDRDKLPVVERLEAIEQQPARRTMGLLVLGVGLVVLVGCVNVAILMIAEGGYRRREIAIRSALGASRSRILGALAGEKCSLTILALGLGVIFAWELLGLLAQLVPAAGLGPPLLRTPALSFYVLLGFGAFALLAALIWSALLAGSATANRRAQALAEGGGVGYSSTGASSSGVGRWRLLLLAGQAGIGLCLLAAAVLSTRAYLAASRADLGPAPSQTALFAVRPRDDINLSDAQNLAWKQQLLSRLGALPDIKSVALADSVPPVDVPAYFSKQGDVPTTDRPTLPPLAVSPGYFQVLGIPLLFGRGLSDSDNNPSAQPVAVINLALAESNWAVPQQAIGTEISIEGAIKRSYRVIGIAGNFTGYWFQKPRPTIYVPESQSWVSGGTVLLRTSAAGSLAELARQALSSLPVPVVVSDDSTMQARWQATLTRPQARMAGMLLLALLGLALTIQGVYAVSAAAVEARAHELAVRSVLGAQSRQLVWNVARELAVAVALGAGAGTLVALKMQPLLRHWLGAATTLQAWPIAGAIALLLVAALAGGYFPAWAAARSDPAAALRRG